MKVSVIITTYKRNHYLREAIDSVLAQSFGDFELILVDDDPFSDETEKIVMSYKDSRITYVKNEKNLKGSKSLNVGLKMAKGEYIAILDDDDSWISGNKLEKQVDFLEKNTDYVIVGTSSVIVDSDSGKEISRITDCRTDSEMKKIILESTPFAHSSVLYRKDAALSVGGYDENLPRAKDLDFCLKMAKIGKMGFIPECFIKYRDISSKERNIIKTRRDDLFFQKKVILRHRKDYFHFRKVYFIINVKYVAFSILKYIPFPYYIYKKMNKISKKRFFPNS